MFGRLPTLPPSDTGGAPPPPSAREPAAARAHSPRLQVTPDPGPPLVAAAAVAGAAEAPGSPGAAAPGTPPAADGGAADAAPPAATASTTPPNPAAASTATLSPAVTPRAASPLGAPPPPGYGVAALVEVLAFIISLAGAPPPPPAGRAGGEPRAGLAPLGVRLLCRALSAGGPSFSAHPALLALLADDAWAALTSAAASSADGLALAARAALLAYVHLPASLFLQVGAFAAACLLPDAAGPPGGAATPGSGPPTALHRQAAALEGLLDLLRQPGFARDAFVNGDCRVERPDLLETVAGVCARAASPAGGPRAPAHDLALDCILAVLAELDDRGTGGRHDSSDSDDGDDGASAADGGADGDGLSPADAAAVWAAVSAGAPTPAPAGRPPRSRPRARPPSPGAAARSTARTTARGALRAALAERAVKARLAAVADVFNKAPDKGLERLTAAGLAPSPPSPADVAALLRHCPAVSRDAAGDLLGEGDEFAVAVLDAFARSFDFSAASFDSALRAFLASFRLPGEAQKISRVMEAFGSRFHAAHPARFTNADACYVLAYSAIMLHTDAHNAQVKKKMTAAEFVRNNRGINGGADLPADYLSSLYASIVAVPLAVATPDAGGGGGGGRSGGDPAPPLTAAAAAAARAAKAAPPPGLWARLAAEARAPRGARVDATAFRCRALDAAALRAVWAPAAAAAATALDGCARGDAARAGAAIDGLALLARAAAHHRVDDAVDAVAAVLAGHAVAPLEAGGPAAALAFGADARATAAAEALFALAARCGDSLRAGWRSLVDVLLRLHGAGLLPPDALGAGAAPLPSPRPRRGDRGSLFSRALSSLISVDAPASPELPRGGEGGAAAAAAAVDACRVADVVADSKFLRAEALADLAAAAAAAGVAELASAEGVGGAAGAEVCLELLFALAARNRDRAALAWPPAHALVAAVLAAGSGPAAPPSPPPAVARAAAGVLAAAAHAAPARAGAAAGAPPALATLALLTRLPPAHAWELAPMLAAGAAALAGEGAPALARARDWKAVISLLSSAALHPRAGATAVQGVLAAADPGRLSLAAYPHVLAALAAVAEGRAKGAPPDAADQAAAALEGAAVWLVSAHAAAPPVAAGGAPAAALTRAPSVAALARAPSAASLAPPLDDPDGEGDATPADAWAATVAAACRLASDSGATPATRDAAVGALAACLGGGDALALPPALLLPAVADGVAPAVARLAACARGGGRDPGAPRAAATAARAMVKGLLGGLPAAASAPGFGRAWDRALSALAAAAASGAPDLAEAAPEAAKNALLVAAAAGVLEPGWADAESGDDLWARTWARAAAVHPSLTPSILSAAAAATVTAGGGVEGEGAPAAEAAGPAAAVAVAPAAEAAAAEPAGPVPASPAGAGEPAPAAGGTPAAAAADGAPRSPPPPPPPAADGDDAHDDDAQADAAGACRQS